MTSRAHELDDHDLERLYLRKRPKRPAMKVSGKSVFQLQRTISKSGSQKRRKAKGK